MAESKRDSVLRRMLKTPPQPHKAANDKDASKAVNRLAKIIKPGKSEFEQQEARKALAAKKRRK